MRLFSGVISEDQTSDIKKELSPNYSNDVRNIKSYRDVFEKNDLVIADPPYDKLDFERYGCEPFNKVQVIRDLGEIMKPGAFWLG